MPEVINYPRIDVQEGFTASRKASITCWSRGEELEAGILLPDDHDRLVVAATTRPNAQAVVASNTDDFPGETLSPLGLEAVHPNDFLLDQLPQAANHAVWPAPGTPVKTQASRSRNAQTGRAPATATRAAPGGAQSLTTAPTCPWRPQ
jgi:hypothetical protein